MKIITLMNEKGGCGKSTLALNLVGTLIKMGIRVLLLDIDPQAHLTGVLLPKVKDKSYSFLSDFLFGDVEKLPVLRYANFGLVAGDSGTSFVSAENYRSVHEKLRQALEKEAQNYNIAIIDSPGVAVYLRPVLAGLSDLFLIPVLPSVLDINGAEKIFEFLSKDPDLRNRVTPRVVINMASRAKADVANINLAKSRFPGMVMDAQIRANKTLRTYSEKGVPIYFAKSAKVGKEDFEVLVNEILSILNYYGK